MKCRQLFHQYIVDMFAKIKTEQLLFTRLNQTKLRLKEYIHLRDLVANDGNMNQCIGKIGNSKINKIATFIRSPWHMHEYTQDAYDRSNLFITFTCVCKPLNLFVYVPEGGKNTI